MCFGFLKKTIKNGLSNKKIHSACHQPKEGHWSYVLAKIYKKKKRKEKIYKSEVVAYVDLIDIINTAAITKDIRTIISLPSQMFTHHNISEWKIRIYTKTTSRYESISVQKRE